MHPLPVVLLNLVLENLPRFSDRRDASAHTGSYDMILQPLVGAFNFAFRLRRQRIDRFHAAIVQYNFPLRVNVIGEFTIGVPRRVLVAVLHIPEYAVLIGIYANGIPYFKHTVSTAKMWNQL